MENQIFGYCRVSTREQNEDRQRIALQEFGIPEEKIHTDKQSGKDYFRPAYQMILDAMQPGDVLVVKSIDRLGRDYHETLEQWRAITKVKQCAIVVLDMPLLDTRQKDNRDLTGTFIADLVLNILSYVAETERAAIKQRQREGIEAAKRRGVQFGRPPKKRTPHWYKLLDAWKENKITARDAAKALHINHQTFVVWANSQQ